MTVQGEETVPDTPPRMETRKAEFMRMTEHVVDLVSPAPTAADEADEVPDTPSSAGACSAPSNEFVQISNTSTKKITVATLHQGMRSASIPSPWSRFRRGGR